AGEAREHRGPGETDPRDRRAPPADCRRRGGRAGAGRPAPAPRRFAGPQPRRARPGRGAGGTRVRSAAAGLRRSTAADGSVYRALADAAAGRSRMRRASVAAVLFAASCGTCGFCGEKPAPQPVVAAPQPAPAPVVVAPAVAAVELAVATGEVQTRHGATGNW